VKDVIIKLPNIIKKIAMKMGAREKRGIYLFKVIIIVINHSLILP